MSVYQKLSYLVHLRRSFTPRLCYVNLAVIIKDIVSFVEIVGMATLCYDKSLCTMVYFFIKISLWLWNF